jgi:tripartite ATP-independent transporter DctM subunit
MMVMSYWFARRFNYPIEETFQVKLLVKTFKEAALTFALPFIILGGIFGGFVTATEAAALAVLASLLISAVYREMSLHRLKAAIIEGGVHTAVVMLLVASSVLIGVYLTEAQVPQKLAAGIMSIADNKYFTLAILNVFFLVVGLFLHSAAAIILVVPIVMPIVHAAGIDPVHFGLIVTLNLGIGQQTPPAASVLVTACSVAKADVWDVTKVNIYFIGVLFAALMLVTYVPIVPMGLVELFYR